MSATDERPEMLSAFLAAVERAYDDINRELFESALSKKPVITISPTPGSCGHFTPWESWKDADGNGRYEINLGAETIDCPTIELMDTLVHEMVHQYCHENGLADTSRSGTYHNKTFRREAMRRGLRVEHDSRVGWGLTSPGDALLALDRRGLFDHIDNTLHRIGASRTAREPGKARSSTRKYVCPSCGMSVRATRKVNVMCMDCEERLTTDEED